MKVRLRHLAVVVLAASPIVTTHASPVFAAAQLGLVHETFNVRATSTLDITMTVPTSVSLSDPTRFNVVVTAYRAVGTRVMLSLIHI